MSKSEEFRKLFIESILNTLVETASSKAPQYKVTSPEEFDMLIAQDPTYDPSVDDGKFIDWIFSLWRNYKTDKKNEENFLVNNNNKLRAIFYIFIFCFFLVLLISSYRKGKIFMVNYFILFVGFVFLFLDNFFEDKYDCIKKTHYYIFIISGGLMWIIGILKLINNGFLSKEETILLGKTD